MNIAALSADAIALNNAGKDPQAFDVISVNKRTGSAKLQLSQQTGSQPEAIEQARVQVERHYQPGFHDYYVMPSWVVEITWKKMAWIKPLDSEVDWSDHNVWLKQASALKLDPSFHVGPERESVSGFWVSHELYTHVTQLWKNA